MTEVSLFKNINDSRKERRGPLQERMSCLDSAEINCSNCSGKCCTMMANSMMITPIEAIDLYMFLNEKSLYNDELISKLKQCIKDFRLDEFFDLGRGRTLRRTYTCPFYMTTFPGCPFPTEVKPYGCLAFNPTKGRPTNGEGCSSSLDLLEKRENCVPEEIELNQILKDQLDLNWDKLPIPVALLEIDNAKAKTLNI